MFSTCKITVLIIDNHPTTVAGIRQALSQTSSIEVIGETQSEEGLCSLVKKLKPNIILLSNIIVEPKPLEFIKWACKYHPCTKIIIFSSTNEDKNLAAMINAGVSGYLSKEEGGAFLIKTIQQTARGETLFSNEQYTSAQKWGERVGEKINQLTRREVEVVKLLAKGFNNQKIAESLNISAKTAAYHLGNILLKLQVKSRQEATIWALKNLADELE